MGFSRKNKRAAKKAARTATSRVEKLSDSAQTAAQDGLSKLSDTVVPAVTEGAKEAKAKASDLVDQYLPQVQDAVHTQGEKLSELADKLGPRAEKLRHEIRDDYLPRARRTAGATNAVVATAVTAAVDAARKELDKGQADIKAAYSKPVKKKGRAGKVLLLIALASAGAAAGYVVWKRSRPVEDPWAPPADFARAHYPSAGATDTDSSEVSDSVGGAEAGDVAQSLGAKTPDRTADTTPHDVKVDHAEGADAAGTHRAEGEAETGKVIDPVLNPDENPADPKRGNHRSDS